MLHSQINDSVILIEVEGDEVVNTVTDGAIHDGVHRNYQDLLYFKNVMQFYYTHLNRLHLCLQQKYGLTCSNFHETCKCSTALYVDKL